ncbi:hypothetical protein N7466_004048 [Penicillium verhagenii]|uniref:uncharacterized protein n=1 Tax=Penicillium verhagenii TaxID=1562060 RepID=UPI0025455C16|nr:uncharacterized protein N7466_004048 [Penicillium verhagenii]KAJ5934501.1 hypothetical protein N7466_004048 [Penicillium verhagenii]
MHYSLLTLATVLAHTQAQAVPMPFGLGSVPIPQGQANGNIGGINGQDAYAATPSSSASMMPAQSHGANYHQYMHAPSASASASASMMPQRPSNYHYHMTPMVSSSASHYINMHAASASASMPFSVSASAHASATPSARAGHSHAPNHGLHAPHAHEGFPAPAGLPKAPDAESYNGASTKHGGYTGGNGNGFTQTHGDDSSSDGSPPLMENGPQMGESRDDRSGNAPTPVDQDVAPIPDSRPGSGDIAPVGNPMAPGSNVAPVLPQKSHGVDEGNGFCLGQCYQSPDQAQCAQPYVSFVPVFFPFA